LINHNFWTIYYLWYFQLPNKFDYHNRETFHASKSFLINETAKVTLVGIMYHLLLIINIIIIAIVSSGSKGVQRVWNCAISINCTMIIHLLSLKNNIMAKILHFRHFKVIIKWYIVLRFAKLKVLICIKLILCKTMTDTHYYNQQMHHSTKKTCNYQHHKHIKLNSCFLDVKFTFRSTRFS